ncbi:ABC transporter substrate-binding protein [Salibacterium aidingense]|uniref:ABC transporter substrate-binding protein n=1 Tax=Salibacterium aidingense TaxID=384933 RepID=UPI0004152AEE|nr:ABC transporter substrate-binding protein [Salibacterium aidingense]
MLALGIEPGGAAGWVFDVPYYEEDLENTEAVGDKESVSVEKMVEVNPDIIFTYMEDSYDQLSQIAPTVYIPFGSYNYRDLLLEMGDILNREEEAEDWLDSFDETVAAKKKELFDHIGEDETVALIELSEKDVFLYGDSYGRGGEILYNELGLNAPEPVEEIAFEEGWAKISMETIPEYLGDADHIFLGVRGESVGEGDGGQRKDELESLDVWNSLKAVENGNVYEYDVDTYYFSDPLALDTQLDEIVDALIEK